MRIAIVTDNWDTVLDGASDCIQRLVYYLCSNEHNVVVVTVPNSKPPQNRHIHPETRIIRCKEYVAFPSTLYTLGLFDDDLATELTSFAPNVVHVASPGPLGIAVLEWCKHRTLPIATVATFHTDFAKQVSYHYSFLPPVVSWYLLGAFRLADKVLAPTPSMARKLVKRGYTGVGIWERGVDHEVFYKRDKLQVERWLDSHCIPRDAKIVVFVGRLVREKNIDAVAATFRNLKARGVDYKPLVVGDGPSKEMMRDKCPSDTTFTGHITPESLAIALSASTVFLFPSDTETFGRVTLEALACGLPVVGCDAPGTRDIVVDLKNGYLVEDPTDEDVFADCCEFFFEDENLHEEFSRAAIEHASKFKWDVLFQRMHDVYNDAWV
jgi:glycosyltransferase involved in cell wall biosynthesis